MIYGVIIGLSSWLFLRDRLRLSARWIPLTVLGFSIGNGLAAYLLYAVIYGEDALFDLGVWAFLDWTYGIVNGLCVAICQAIALRGSRLSPLPWFWLTWIGIAVGEYVGWYFILNLFSYDWLDGVAFMFEAIAGGTAGVIVGGMTGLALLSMPSASDSFDSDSFDQDSL